ncbi:MAG: DUF177 domain-containing protein [bacterium]|nr:DUF177 domain-containing protein [bacterium]
MKQSQNYISNRVLKINVGFLLSDGPAHSQDSVIDFPKVRVSDDLTLEYVRGPLRLSRTSEGILVQADLEAAVEAECYRCLEATDNVFQVHLEELFATDGSVQTDFRVHDDGILDLAPLLRDEALLAIDNRVLCRPDCKGLCPECGSNLNIVPCQCELESVDPRLAALKNLLDTQ